MAARKTGESLLFSPGIGFVEALRLDGRSAASDADADEAVLCGVEQLYALVEPRRKPHSILQCREETGRLRDGAIGAGPGSRETRARSTVPVFALTV